MKRSVFDRIDESLMKLLPLLNRRGISTAEFEKLWSFRHKDTDCLYIDQIQLPLKSPVNSDVVYIGGQIIDSENILLVLSNNRGVFCEIAVTLNKNSISADGYDFLWLIKKLINIEIFDIYTQRKKAKQAALDLFYQKDELLKKFNVARAIVAGFERAERLKLFVSKEFFNQRDFEALKQLKPNYVVTSFFASEQIKLNFALSACEVGADKFVKLMISHKNFVNDELLNLPIFTDIESSVSVLCPITTQPIESVRFLSGIRDKIRKTVDSFLCANGINSEIAQSQWNLRRFFLRD